MNTNSPNPNSSSAPPAKGSITKVQPGSGRTPRKAKSSAYARTVEEADELGERSIDPTWKHLVKTLNERYPGQFRWGVLRKRGNNGAPMAELYNETHEYIWNL